MNKFLKVSILFFLVSPMLLGAQITDSLRIKNNTHLPIQTVIDSVSSSKLVDTISSNTKRNKKKNDTPDVLYLLNGDKLTGKIVSFEQGRLRFDAQGPGNVYIKWYKIKSISGGSKVYRVENDKGEIFIGRIIENPISGEITVLSIPKQELKLEHVIRIYPLETEWFKGFKGDLGGGVSYTKSSDVFRINAESNLYYVISKWRFVSNLSYISTSTRDSDFSERIQFTLQEFYTLQNKWFLYEQNSFNRNDELGIDAKISFGIGGGNFIVLTEKQKLKVFSGILQNFEKTIQRVKFTSDIEWPLALQHNIYSFLHPNLTSSTSLTSFVGITEQGRYRFDASTDLTWEFVTNFKLELSFYYNYDNKIIQGKNNQEDYGYVLSLLLNLK
ncbi:MAG: DUF481 domain-containing protein [Flavobacterium sp.]|nr:DUF481 domain-containing protein [Flavobacterium sp.]